MTEKLSEYHFGYLNGDGYFNGVCRGGPYDGQKLSWNESTYGIVCCLSTGPYPPGALEKAFDHIAKYDNTKYVFTDSTWVWKSE